MNGAIGITHLTIDNNLLTEINIGEQPLLQTVELFESLKTTRVNKLEKSFEELDEVNKRLDD